MAFPNASPTIRRALPILALLLWLAVALVHVVTGSDQAFVEQYIGRQRLVFTYLDAKHMVTGYDHLLFLFDVCFFLYRMRDVGAYVAFFAIRHSLTLLYGVLGGVHVSSYLIDAIIGLSLVYKALEKLGAFECWFGFQPHIKAAALVFGIFHGLGLATKPQDLELSQAKPSTWAQLADTRRFSTTRTPRHQGPQGRRRRPRSHQARSKGLILRTGDVS